MRIISTLLIFVLILCLCFDLKGNASGQSEKTDTLQFAENVYLHVDRSRYISGEDIWFKAYVINPSTNKLSLNTNNLHVEITDHDGDIIQARTVRISKGTGHGDFSLDDSIPSGRYRIRAYTNHMRNYGNDRFFVKEITVVNPGDSVELQLPVRNIDNKIDISFFPEGGSLIDNVTSTIGFKAVNALGKGCDVNVRLYSSSGELITVFNSTRLGMGFFNLKPLPGYDYYTIVRGTEGTEIKAPLPESFRTGVAIRTVITNDNNLILTINTNEATLPSLTGKDLNVEVSLRNLVHKTTNLNIDSLVNNFLIPLDDIPDGVLRVTLGVPGGLPFCERLVFLQRSQNERLLVTTDKKEYKPREKVTATIAISGDSSLTVKGDFSIAAVERRMQDNSSRYPGSVASWFLLESDIRGRIEDPGYYFDPDNEKRFQDLDLLLMTQGWRDFRWKYDTLVPFLHETGFTLRGNVKRILNNNPVPGAKINAAFFYMNTTEFMDAKTDKDGRFMFEGLDVYGKVRVFLSSTGKLENMQGKISVDPSVYKPPLIEKQKEDTVTLVINQNEFASYKQEASFRLNALKKYKLVDTIYIGEVTITAKREETTNEIKVKESRRYYSVPDKELIVPTSAENYAGDIFSYMSGRIPGIRILRAVDPESPIFPDDVKVFIRGQFSLNSKTNNTNIQNSDNSEFGVTNFKDKMGALILLDGLEVDELSLPGLLLLPMSSVDRIDVLNASPAYGMRGANGVINIITKAGLRREPVKIAPNSIYTSFQGFDVPRVFYSPVYEIKSDQTVAPDYRSTIFWNPDMPINNFPHVTEFYNGDSPTQMEITVEGVTSNGLPLASKSHFTVVSP